ncbi:MAG: aldo/keto reductase [Pseudomonadota bacterium]
MITFGAHQVERLGMGTWGMGERADAFAQEVHALQAGLDQGLTLIDTAEMYGDGGAEEVVGAAIAGRREACVIVSKVYPHNAGRREAIAACERSLARLKVEHIDVYLLHWRGRVALTETVEAFETLKRDGKIGHWGVSNFDVDDMDELGAWVQPSEPSGLGASPVCATNQVLYHLGSRGIEWDLLPQMHKSGMPVMAYSPLGQRAILGAPVLNEIARARSVMPAAIALAWVLREQGIIAIPKAVSLEHIEANMQALNLSLSADEMAMLDAAFPPPQRKMPLEII